MAITGDETKKLVEDFRKQRESLAQQKFHQIIGWSEMDFDALMNDFEDKVGFVAYSEAFLLNPGRVPFLMIFPPPNERQLKDRLAHLGFSEAFNQVQIKLSKIDDVEYYGKHPYMIFDVDPGNLIKNARYSAMILQRMKPIRRRLNFFEAVSMAPFLNRRPDMKIGFQIVITGSRYLNEEISPAIDFAFSKANPVINHFDLDNISARIGVPSCCEYTTYKPPTSF